MLIGFRAKCKKHLTDLQNANNTFPILQQTSNGQWVVGIDGWECPEGGEECMTKWRYASIAGNVVHDEVS